MYYGNTPLCLYYCNTVQMFYSIQVLDTGIDVVLDWIYTTKET